MHKNSINYFHILKTSPKSQKRGSAGKPERTKSANRSESRSGKEEKDKPKGRFYFQRHINIDSFI